MPSADHFGWLHLTDLHYGLSGQRPLWPNVRTAFFDDLEKLHDRCGPWHAVLFTGDLVQAGRAEEFQALEDEVLPRLWGELRRLGSGDAVLLAVPGNHDLVRPDAKRPTPAVRWLLGNRFAEIQEEFWSEPDGDYRRVVATALANYAAWWGRTAFRPGNSVPLQAGLLPGDFAVTLPAGSRRIGIVGMNTTFLQLAGGDYRGRLAWDLAQLAAVCGPDMSDWFAAHDACLLLTHQGPEWLDSRSRDEVYSEINPAGRFAVHLFGHMHETVVRSISTGGGRPLRQWQTCSLFGLETFGEPPRTERRHGYGAGRLELGDGGATLRFWPRLATRDANGWRLIPDRDSCLLLEDEGTAPDEIREARRSPGGSGRAASRPVLARVTPALTGGFFAAIRQLVEIEPASFLRPKAAKIQGWLSSAGAPRDGERRLAEALTRTVDELRQAIESEFADRVLGYLGAAESDPAIPLMVAAATLEMTRDDAAVAPPYLLRQMRIQEVHRAYFGSFLFLLRRHLAIEEGYSAAISYADDLAGAGVLEGFADSVAGALDHAARLEAMLAFELKSRRLSDSHRAATSRYLAHLRERQLVYSPLPLVKGAQVRAGARIKDIFVPIAVRSKKGERDGGMQSFRRHPDEAGGKQNSTELGALILGEGRVVLLGPPGSGKTTMLMRTALALAEGRSEDIPGWGDSVGAVPIFLRLSSLAAYLEGQRARFFEACPASTIAYLENHYREQQRVSLTPDFFDRMLDEGGCAVFMDGLDEVPAGQRVEVAKHVESFIARYGESPGHEKPPIGKDRGLRRNVFVLSSRPKGFEPIEFFLRPAAVAVCEVKPLEPAGIRRLVGNLLTIIELDKSQRAQDFDGLCNAIFRETDLLVLAGTPLFCTSLVLVYKYHGAELPQRRIDVFAEIVDLLLGFWKAQDQKVIQLGRADEDDGTGTANLDLGTAVKMKKRRLDHIALHMQLSEKRTEIDFPSLVGVLSAYLVEKERTPPEQARALAEKFLVTSHERSGLLVETESSDPPIYAFTHEGFREYLVADALANLREAKFISTVLDNIDNPTWEEVIVLAGAHPGLSDDLREYLLEECVEAAGACKANGNAEGWARRLTMAGRMARDMGEYLSPKDRAKLREVLTEAMADAATQLKYRLGVALSLDELGWLTDTLFAFVAIPAAGAARFCIGKTAVANVQYQRFLNAADFGDAELWADLAGVDVDGRPCVLDASYALPWNRGAERLPKSWNDPKFGIAHRGLPIVGISWFEASAYCRWLQRHWDELEEARINPALRPRGIRLPTEDEWSLAVFGGTAERRFPWDEAAGPRREPLADLSAYANAGKLLDRTSPIGTFLHGASRPFGLIDFCGNVWEWQANHFDHSRRAIALRGGAYTTELTDCAADLRGWRDPGGRDNDIGFRVLIEV